MCGIFGFITSENHGYSSGEVAKRIRNLLELSVARGKEASGLAAATPDKLFVLKRPVIGSRLAAESAFKVLIAEAIRNSVPINIIGHCRLVTNGASERHQNNQPVIGTDIVGIHNGIVVNDAEVYANNAALTKDLQVDTEVLLDFMRWRLGKGDSMQSAAREMYRQIKGSASIAFQFADFAEVLLATNNGSMYYATGDGGQWLVFASEIYIVQEFLSRFGSTELSSTIKHLEARSAALIGSGRDTVWISEFSLDGSPENADKPVTAIARRLSVDLDPLPDVVRYSPSANFSQLAAMLNYDESDVRAQLRCVKCLLPASFPHLSFDSMGVCDHCRFPRDMTPRGEKAFLEALAKESPRAGEPHGRALLALSGGRDSCFALHYLAKVLGLPVIAYTYDWGVVTDLARRNMSRMCADLGIEHIIVSADIARKRENIRKNVLAWLKRPHLGVVPLFMAGDKQFFHYANSIMRQNSLNHLVFGMNPLEQTDFKVGFCNVKKNNAERHYNLSPMNQARMLWFYASQFAANPAYINSSAFDTLFGYFAYYLGRHDYHILYQYLPWNEDKIVSTLLERYEWETSPDTTTTWRIGDGTASFYNYIYYSFAGFTESDTFRSNQIRCGMLDRTKGLEMIVEENRPRFESIRWYCETIGLDFSTTISRINEAARVWRGRESSAVRAQLPSSKVSSQTSP